MYRYITIIAIKSDNFIAFAYVVCADAVGGRLVPLAHALQRRLPKFATKMQVRAAIVSPERLPVWYRLLIAAR